MKFEKKDILFILMLVGSPFLAFFLTETVSKYISVPLGQYFKLSGTENSYEGIFVIVWLILSMISFVVYEKYLGGHIKSPVHYKQDAKYLCPYCKRDVSKVTIAAGSPFEVKKSTCPSCNKLIYCGFTPFGVPFLTATHPGLIAILSIGGAIFVTIIMIFVLYWKEFFGS